MRIREEIIEKYEQPQYEDKTANKRTVVATAFSLIIAVVLTLCFTATCSKIETTPEPEFVHPTVPVAFAHEGYDTTDSWDQAMRFARMRGQILIDGTVKMMADRPEADWSQAKARLFALRDDLDHAYSLSQLNVINEQLRGLNENVLQLNVAAIRQAEQIKAQEEAMRAEAERQAQIQAEQERINNQQQVNNDPQSANVDTNVYTQAEGTAPQNDFVPQPETDPILNGLEYWVHWNQNEPNWADYTDLDWWDGCATVSEAMVLATYSGNIAYTPDWMAANGLSIGHGSPYSFRYTDNGDLEVAFGTVSRYVNANPDIFHLKATWDVSWFNSGDFELIRKACASGGCAHVRINPNVISAYQDQGMYSPAGIHSVVIVKVEGDRVVISDPGVDGFIITSVDEVVNAFRITNPTTGEACVGHSFELFERIP